jgi:hypothetical protein
MNKVVGLCSNKKELRITKKTPAVTRVAAWIKADTGVGPSMASGNQICKPSCADLPRAPQKRKKVITVNLSRSKPKNEKLVPTAQGESAKTTK